MSSGSDWQQVEQPFPATRDEWHSEAITRYVEARRRLSLADEGLCSYQEAVAYVGAGQLAAALAALLPPTPRWRPPGTPPRPHPVAQHAAEGAAPHSCGEPAAADVLGVLPPG